MPGLQRPISGLRRVTLAQEGPSKRRGGLSKVKWTKNEQFSSLGASWLRGPHMANFTPVGRAMAAPLAITITYMRPHQLPHIFRRV